MSTTTPRELSKWLQLKINDNDTMFDASADLFDIILSQLNEKQLHIKAENKILMIKLCKFLYENSYH
jgi:hypothetical protein